jgi:hypothetical protein
MLLWHSGRVEEWNHEGLRFEPRWWHFSFSFVGKLNGNCWKVDGKLSENSAECQRPSKYSIFIVGTRRINLISMSKKCSVTLTLEYCVIQSGWRSFPSTLFTVCVCEQFIYYHDRAAYTAARNVWTDPRNIHKSLTDT